MPVSEPAGSTYYKAFRVGGGARVEDMLHAIRRAEAGVDESDHHALMMLSFICSFRNKNE